MSVNTMNIIGLTLFGPGWMFIALLSNLWRFSDDDLEDLVRKLGMVLIIMLIGVAFLIVAAVR